MGFSAYIVPVAAAAHFTIKSTKCMHCGRLGHDASSCFQLHGYPDWWTESRKSLGRSSGRGRGAENSNHSRGRGTSFHLNNLQLDPMPAAGSSGIPNFTPEQWSSLATFMNNQKNMTSEKPSAKKDTLFLIGPESRYDVIIDSGASHHMTGDINLLTALSLINPCAIRLPNGGITWVTCHGILDLGGRLIFHIVFYAPHLTITLISVSQLLRDLAGLVIFKT